MGGAAVCPESLDPIALSLQALMFLARLLRLTLGAPSAAGASALELRLRHAHHLFGDAVCLLLIFVSRLVDRQFRLYRSCCRRMYGNPAKIVPKAR